MNPDTLKDERLLSMLKDPFLTEHMQSLNFSLVRVGDVFRASATIFFNNYPTTGQQSFTGDNLMDVIAQVRDFMDQLKNKS